MTHTIAVICLIFCASFLGTWAANALGAGHPKTEPRHPKAHRFPLDLDQADHPSDASGEL